MKTFVAKPKDVNPEWLLLDVTDLTLGKISVEIANRLRGKKKAIFTPHVDTGDYVVVINSAKVKLSGNKEKDKKYFRHSGYPGGIKESNFLDMQKRNPGKAIFLAVKGMMPKGPLGYNMIKKLKIYSDNKHPHQAQNPKPIKLI